MKSGDVLDGRYRIDAPLAKGGMGAVYQATHLGTDRRVALKVINRDLVSSPVMLERFRREARAAGRLSHPHVVNVTDFGLGDLDGKPVAYLVMEYLHGRTLRDLLKERKQLPLDLAVDITEQVALAVDAAHALGIVHRDLKPENIWLVPNGADRFHAKVLDFGIAKLREELEVAPAQLPPSLVSSLANVGEDDIIVVGESAPRPVTFAAQSFAAKNFAAQNVVAHDAPTVTPPTRAPAHSGAADALGLSSLSGAMSSASMPSLPHDARTMDGGAMGGPSLPSLPHDAPTIGGPSLPSLEHDAPTHTGASPSSMTPESGVSWKSVRTPSSRSASSQSFLSTPGSAQLTEVGGILGTPYYMAPEQFRGDVVDEKADIYALGVCIYQMLSGDVPHRGSVGQLVLVHTDKTPPPPMGATVPRAVEDVVVRSLAWEPSSRPSSAGLVAAALKGAAEGEDVVRRRALALPASELVMCAGVTVVPYLVPLTLLVLAAQESTKLWYLAPVLVVVIAALSALTTMATAAFLRASGSAKDRARAALRLTLARLPKAPSAMIAVLSGNALAPALFARDAKATSSQARALADPVRQVLRALALRTWAAAIVVTCTIPFASLARALALDALQGSLRQGATPSPLLALVVALFGVLTALGPVLVGLALQLPVSLTAVELLDNARAIAGEHVERPVQSAKSSRPRTLYGFALAAVGVLAWFLVVTVGFEAAVLHDDAEAVAVLMNLGANPNPTATRQPLHDAAFAGKARVVDALLQGGADPNALDRLPGAGGGATPLIAAISAGSPDCVRLLLQHGANPNLAAKNGETPLHEAVTRKSSSSRIQIVRMLLERGASARTPGIDGKTPAELAAADGDEGLAKMFVGR